MHSYNTPETGSKSPTHGDRRYSGSLLSKYTCMVELKEDSRGTSPRPSLHGEGTMDKIVSQPVE